MKRLIIFLCILTLFLLQGCLVKSLHPFYKPGDVVFRKELINEWADQDGNRWQILPVNEDQSAYELRHYKQGSQSPHQTFIAHLFKLGDKLYLDVFPLARDPNDDAYMFEMHLMPTHSIARVETLSEKEVEIRWFNEKWLNSLFEQNKIKISHEVVRDPVSNNEVSYVLTASTEEMQKFIIKYGDEDKAFTDDGTIWLKLTR